MRAVLEAWGVARPPTRSPRPRHSRTRSRAEAGPPDRSCARCGRSGAHRRAGRGGHRPSARRAPRRARPSGTRARARRPASTGRGSRCRDRPARRTRCRRRRAERPPGPDRWPGGPRATTAGRRTPGRRSTTSRPGPTRTSRRARSCPARSRRTRRTAARSARAPGAAAPTTGDASRRPRTSRRKRQVSKLRRTPQTTRITASGRQAGVLDGVDAAHADDGAAAQTQRCAATAGPAGEEDGENQPGHHRAGQRLPAARGRCRADAGRTRTPRPRAALPAPEADRPGHPTCALARDDQQERRPEPLGHPTGHPERVGQHEPGALREQVAVGLVLELAEVRLRVPQRERAGQERSGRSVSSARVS